MRKNIVVTIIVVFVVSLLFGTVAMADASVHEAGTIGGASTSMTVLATINVYQWYDVDVSISPGYTDQTLIAANPNVYNPQPTQFVFSIAYVYSNSATVDVAVSISNDEDAGSGFGDFENSLKSHISSFEYAPYVLRGSGPTAPWEMYTTSWHNVKGGTNSNTSLNFVQLRATQNTPLQGNGRCYYMAARFNPDYGAPAGKYPVVFTIHFQATVTFP